MGEAAGEARTSLDAILGGRLRLRQPIGGHRVGADAVLLAAAAGAPARRIVDVGAGVGAVGLALLQRWPEARGDLVEIDPELAALARDNAALNGLRPARASSRSTRSRRARRREAGLADGEADLVVTNPPFFDALKVRASPDAGRARAHVAPARRGAASAARSLDRRQPRPAGAGRALRHDPSPRRARPRSSPRSGAGSAASRCCRSIREPSKTPIGCWSRASRDRKRRCASRRPSCCTKRPAPSRRWPRPFTAARRRSTGPRESAARSALTRRDRVSRVRRENLRTRVPCADVFRQRRRLARSREIVPGPDSDPSEFLGQAGLRDLAALRHGSRRRHFPSRHDLALARARSPGRRPMCSPRAVPRTGAMARTPIACSTITSSR